jgi:hypothetical protein
MYTGHLRISLQITLYVNYNFYRANSDLHHLVVNKTYVHDKSEHVLIVLFLFYLKNRDLDSHVVKCKILVDMEG